MDSGKTAVKWLRIAINGDTCRILQPMNHHHHQQLVHIKTSPLSPHLSVLSSQDLFPFNTYRASVLLFCLLPLLSSIGGHGLVFSQFITIQPMAICSSCNVLFAILKILYGKVMDRSIIFLIGSINTKIMYNVETNKLDPLSVIPL